MKIKVTDDVKLREEIRAKIAENGGFCPCAIIHTDDTECMCKDFRDKISSGEETSCHCGLYYTIQN